MGYAPHRAAALALVVAAALVVGSGPVGAPALVAEAGGAPGATDVPRNWTFRAGGACPVLFAVPPREPPYAEWVPTDWEPEGGHWRLWQPGVTSGGAPGGQEMFPLQSVVAYLEDASLGRFGGSDFIPGFVHVHCGPNDGQLATDELPDAIAAAMNAVSSHYDMQVVGTRPDVLWGRYVVAARFRCDGMCSEQLEWFVFATPSQVFAVRRIWMQDSPPIREATERIFLSLRFVT